MPFCRPARDSAEPATKPKPFKKAQPQKLKSDSEVPAVLSASPSPVTTPKRTPVDASTYVANQIRDAMQAEQLEVAAQLYRGHRTSSPEWDLGQADLVALADALHKAQHWNDAAPLTEHCVTRFPDSSLRTRVNLAGMNVEIQCRPRAAMALLQEISRTMVPEKLQSHSDAITSLARQLIEMNIEDRAPPA